MVYVILVGRVGQPISIVIHSKFHAFLPTSRRTRRYSPPPLWLSIYSVLTNCANHNTLSEATAGVTFERAILSVCLYGLFISYLSRISGNLVPSKLTIRADFMNIVGGE